MCTRQSSGSERPSRQAGRQPERKLFSQVTMSARQVCLARGHSVYASSSSLGFTITMVKTIAFANIFIIILAHFFFFDFHQTSQVGTLGDRITLTQFQ